MKHLPVVSSFLYQKKGGTIFTDGAFFHLFSALDVVPPALRALADACHQKGGKTIFDLGEEAGDTEDFKLQDSTDANNLSRRKKPVVHTKDRCDELQQWGSRPNNRFQIGGKAIFYLVEQVSDTEDCKLEGSPDADNLSQGENKKTVHATGRSDEVQQGRSRRRRRQNQARGREERAVVPDRRQLEQYVMMIFLCLLFVAYIWALMDMRLLGHRPIASY